MSSAALASLNAWTASWAGSMLAACWQGSLFLLIVWALTRIVPSMPKSLRGWLWWLVSLKLVVGFLWTTPVSLGLLPPAPLPPIAMPTPPPDSIPAPPSIYPPCPTIPNARADVTVQSLRTKPPLHPVPGTAAPDTAVAPETLSWSSALCGLWLVGVLWQGGWLLRQLLGVRRMVRQARPVEDPRLLAMAHQIAISLGLRRAAHILESEIGCGPFTVGWWRPGILLPPRESGAFSEQELPFILAHEHAHLLRGDLWLALIPICAQLLFFFHPLVWLATREYDLAREAACDDLALQVTRASAHAYGHLLLKLGTLADHTPPTGTLGVTSHFRMLQRRLDMLHQVSRPLRPLLRIGWAALFVTGIVCLVPWRVVAASAPPSDPLAGNPRLDQRVAIAAEGVPVGDLLALLSQKTGATLRADPYVADDKVVIFGPPRPLRAVMADLAALFNDNWLHLTTKDGQERYTLLRDRRAQEYENGLARDTINRLLAQMDAYIKASYETPEQLAARPEHDPIRQHFQWESGRVSAHLLGMLTPEQREILLRNKAFNIPVAALDPQMHAQLMQSISDIYAADEAAAAKDNREYHRPPESDLEKAGVRFTIQSGGDKSGSGSQTIYLTIGFGYSEIPAVLRSTSHWLLPPHGNPYTGKKIAANSPLPSLKTLQALTGQEDWVGRLRKLAESSGQPVMADYYRSQTVAIPLDDPYPPTPSETTAGALDALCRGESYLWWLRDKTLLLRKRNWFTQRQYEVPDRWMRETIRRLQAHQGIPTYTDVLRMGELTTEQIVGLQNAGEGSDLVTSQSFLNGLPELLRILQGASAPGGNDTPLYPENEQTPLKITLNSLPPEHRALLLDFAMTQNGFIGLHDWNMEKFWVQMHCPSPPDAESKKTEVHIMYTFGGVLNPYAISLPLALPDDRTDRTRIAITP
ncbi:MAG TPA: M56 family metallopeptidase [Chthonomonadaceae bacterium]|nr:M56 family metallopeptidase [Chthonomonadaceae bacterium]